MFGVTSQTPFIYLVHFINRNCGLYECVSQVSCKRPFGQDCSQPGSCDQALTVSCIVTQFESCGICRFRSSCMEYERIRLRSCLHGGGGPQVGDVTCCGSPHLSCKSNQIKKRCYMDRRVTPPKRVASPIWGPPPPCKRTLNLINRKV